MLKPRIVLLDDHRILLDAVKGIIEPEFHVVGIFEDARTALDECPKLRPDVIVLDVGMPGMNGISAAAEFKHLLPKTKIVFLTMNRDMDIASEAFRLGASGYVLKTAAASELVHCIRDVLRGGFYASPVLTEGMVGSF